MERVVVDMVFLALALVRCDVCVWWWDLED